MNRKLYHNSGRNVGTIANVDTIEGIARVGTISAYLALSECGFGPNRVKLALSKGGSGPKLGKAGTIVHVGIIQGWIWAKFGPSWHYPKVDLGQNLSKLLLSEGGSDPKFGKVNTIVHVGTIQGWTWA